MLMLSGTMMSNYMCEVYNRAELGRLLGYILAPNATATFQLYDFLTGRCGDFFTLPMNEYFPMVFKVERECHAAIPVYSNIGQDGKISITGYADLVVATKSKIKEVTFIFTQPISDCTLQLQSMVMLDVQCVGLVTPPTETSTSSDPTSTTRTSTSHTIRPTSSYSITSPGVDEGKYTQISTIPGYDDSMNNPIFHRGMPECPITYGKYKIILAAVSYRYAPLVCLRKGMRLASVQREDLGPLIGMVSTCLGPDKAVWIGEFWKSSARPNRCLELESGSSSGSGGINLASSCGKQQAVLCEDPWMPLIR